MYKLTKTTTLVVLDDEDTEYNRLIKHAVDNYWDITETKYVTMEEFLALLPNSGYSSLVKNNRKNPPRQYSGRYTAKGLVREIVHNDIAVFVCDKDSLHHYYSRDEFGSIEVQNVNDASTYEYKLVAMVQNMQHYLKFIRENYSAINRDNYYKKVNKFWNTDAAELENLKLLVCEDDLTGDFGIDKLREKYPHDIEIVSKERISQAIESQEEGVAFIHVAEPVFKYMQAIKAAGGKTIYSAKPMASGRLSLVDFKDMASKAGGKKFTGSKIKDKLKKK